MTVLDPFNDGGLGILTCQPETETNVLIHWNSENGRVQFSSSEEGLGYVQFEKPERLSQTKTGEKSN